MADRRMLALSLWLTIGAGTTLADVPAAGDLVLAPEQLRYCTVCHGVELKGNPAVKAPKLAGLPAWYVTRQLEAFREGWRGIHALDIAGMEMRPQALVLTPEELAAAVDYVVSVPARAAAPTIAGDAARGEQLYAPCGACHGARGEGNRALSSPPLAGQSDWYLLSQLELFDAGARGGPGDTQGAVMQAAMSTLTDEQSMADVVAYIATLDTPARQPEQGERR